MIFEISGYTFSYNITVVINRGNNGRKAGGGEKSNGIVRMKNLSRNQCVFRKAIALRAFLEKGARGIEQHSLEHRTIGRDGGRTRRRGIRLTDLHVSRPKRLRIELTFNSFVLSSVKTGAFEL